VNFNNHYFTEGIIPEFIILIGIPGSGKSFWIAKYNKNNKYRVISPDLIRKEITGNISDQSQNAKVWEITKKRVVNLLKNGINVILDATMTTSQNRKNFIKDLPNAKLKAKIFYVDPEVSKKRIKQDVESGKDRANVPDEVIDRMHDELMKSKDTIEDEGFEIIK
jgi:predicted kinase